MDSYDNIQVIIIYTNSSSIETNKDQMQIVIKYNNETQKKTWHIKINANVKLSI